MIINQNNYDYSIQYKKLFDDAYALLTDENTQIDNSKRPTAKFTCLEEYFMYLDVIAKLHADEVEAGVGASSEQQNARFAKYSKYLMLPLDEEYFKINANSRTISIPSNFAKYGVSLTGDQRAETLLFEIDRYFDFMDLIRTNIHIQWTSPEGKEGTSLITLVDYDSKKIRFGWPLSSGIIDGQGTLKFAVRFFMRNNAEQISYSLNTLPVTVSVKPALRITVDDPMYVDEDSINFFRDAIKPGANSGAENFPEIPVIFLNLPTDKQYLTASNTLTFDIGAYSIDQGDITYNWKRIPYNNPNVAEELPGTYNIIVQDEYVQTKDTAYVNNKPYYIHDGQAYELVDSKTEPFSNTFLERINRCHIAASDELVAGTYKVIVVNRVAKNTTELQSLACIVPAPQSIKYEKDLAANGEKNVLPEDGSALKLSVATAPDDLKANQSYKWFKLNSENGEPIALNDEYQSEPTLDVTTPGWYYVDTKNTLNRVDLTLLSAKSKITNAPQAPAIENFTGNEVIINFNKLENEATIAEIEVKASVATDGLDPALVSEGLRYEWYHQKKDTTDTSELEPVENGAYGVMSATVNEDGNGVLKLQYSGDTEAFVCKVINTLNGKTAVTTSDLYIAMKF